jgi:hypothetical protein
VLISNLKKTYPNRWEEIGLFQKISKKHPLVIHQVWDVDLDSNGTNDYVLNFSVKGNWFSSLEYIGWAAFLQSDQGEVALASMSALSTYWSPGEYVSGLRNGQIVVDYVKPLANGTHHCNCIESQKVYGYKNKAMQLLSASKPQKVKLTRVGGRNDESENLTQAEMLHVLHDYGGESCATYEPQKEKAERKDPGVFFDSDPYQDFLFWEEADLNKDGDKDYVITLLQGGIGDPRGWLTFAVVLGPKKSPKVIHHFVGGSGSPGSQTQTPKSVKDGVIEVSFCEKAPKNPEETVTGTRYYTVDNNKLLVVKEEFD